VLLFFYQIGSSATRYKKAIKQQRDATAAAESNSAGRGASQVLACSAIAVVLSTVRAWHCGEESSVNYDTDPLAASLTCAILAHHAACLADTLASELGMLARQTPVMITQPWRSVPPGTNGGITAVGTAWSGVGGFLMGLTQILMDAISGCAPLNVRATLVFATACGMIGSKLDSILGATLQATFYDADTKRIYHASMKIPDTAQLVSGVPLLNNEQVNLVSVALTTALGGWVIGPYVMTAFR
jgi:uncharacterized protein (TIGR00297 family)